MQRNDDTQGHIQGARQQRCSVMVSPGNYPLEVLSVSIRSHCLRVLSRMTAGTVPYVMLQVKYGMSSPELIPKMAMVAVVGCSAFKWDS